jgi:hypothetical protein
MASQAVFTVTTTATIVTTLDYWRIILQNRSGVDIFVGPTSGVTTTNGLRIADGESFSDADLPASAWYAIVASGTAPLIVVKV